jgi:transcriptional regulator with XRE-family HTH domain
METVGQRIKRLRLELGMKQRELAKKAGVKDPASISQWENDVYIPEASSLIGLALGLKTSPQYILNAKGDRSNSVDFTAAVGEDTAQWHELFLKLSEPNRRAVLAAMKSLADSERLEGEQ